MKRPLGLLTVLLLALSALGGAVAYRNRDALTPWLARALHGEAPALRRGPLVERQVTLAEGLRKEDIARILAAAGLGAEEALLAAMHDDALAREFGVPGTGAGGQASVPGGIEGYLFPDTYRFAVGTAPRDLLRRMRRRLDEVLDDGLRAQMDKRGMTLHETLTLASIVEKETGHPDERARIAGVFFNRLTRGMRLQTDPTVIYGIPDYRGDIKRADLTRDHPYNTYVHAGLPPGPIAQPGLAAIRAVLAPLETQELYFVAKGSAGMHEFCPDLGCHNDAVQKWQRPRARAKAKIKGRPSAAATARRP